MPCSSGPVESRYNCVHTKPRCATLSLLLLFRCVTVRVGSSEMARRGARVKCGGVSVHTARTPCSLATTPARRARGAPDAACVQPTLRQIINKCIPKKASRRSHFSRKVPQSREATGLQLEPLFRGRTRDKFPIHLLGFGMISYWFAVLRHNHNLRLLRLFFQICALRA